MFKSFSIQDRKGRSAECGSAPACTTRNWRVTVSYVDSVLHAQGS